MALASPGLNAAFDLDELDDIDNMDWDTALAYADAVYGPKNGYVIDKTYLGNTVIAVNSYPGMPCEEMRKLASQWRTGIWTLNSNYDGDGAQSARKACGFSS